MCASRLFSLQHGRATPMHNPPPPRVACYDTSSVRMQKLFTLASWRFCDASLASMQPRVHTHSLTHARTRARAQTSLPTQENRKHLLVTYGLAVWVCFLRCSAKNPYGANKQPRGHTQVQQAQTQASVSATSKKHRCQHSHLGVSTPRAP